MQSSCAVCGVCQEPFNTVERRPLLLPECGHTLCAACAHNCQPSCPDCGAEYGQPAATLPTNFAVLQLVAPEEGQTVVETAVLPAGGGDSSNIGGAGGAAGAAAAAGAPLTAPSPDTAAPFSKDQKQGVSVPPVLKAPSAPVAGAAGGVDQGVHYPPYKPAQDSGSTPAPHYPPVLPAVCAGGSMSRGPSVLLAAAGTSTGKQRPRKWLWILLAALLAVAGVVVGVTVPLVLKQQSSSQPASAITQQPFIISLQASPATSNTTCPSESAVANVTAAVQRVISQWPGITGAVVQRYSCSKPGSARRLLQEGALLMHFIGAANGTAGAVSSATQALNAQPGEPCTHLRDVCVAAAKLALNVQWATVSMTPAPPTLSPTAPARSSPPPATRSPSPSPSSAAPHMPQSSPAPAGLEQLVAGIDTFMANITRCNFTSVESAYAGGYDIDCNGDGYCEVCGSVDVVKAACRNASTLGCVAFAYSPSTGCGYLKGDVSLVARDGWDVYMYDYRVLVPQLMGSSMADAVGGVRSDVLFLEAENFDIGPSYDIPRGDMAYYQECGSVEEVKIACRAEVSCVAFTYNDKEMCGYLKSAPDGSRRAGWTTYLAA